MAVGLRPGGLHLLLQGLVGLAGHPGLLILLFQVPEPLDGGGGGGGLLLSLVEEGLDLGEVLAQDEGTHGPGALPELPGGVLPELLGLELQGAELLLEGGLPPDLLVGAQGGEGVDLLPERLRLLVHLQGLLVELSGLLLVLGELGDLLGQVLGAHLVPGAAVVDAGAAGLGVELEDDPAQGGLAAAGLAHHAELLPLVDGEGHVLQGLDAHAPADGEVFFQLLELQKHLSLVTHFPRSSSTLWQLTVWPGSISSSAGTSVRHRSVA